MHISNSKSDFDTTLHKALEEIDPDYMKYEGIIIPGSHSVENIEHKLFLIKTARENNMPLLGICMGMQLMCIEYARNVLGIKDATSEELGSGTHIIIQMPQLRVGQYPVTDNLNRIHMESHWHNYKFNPDFAMQFSKDFAMNWTEGILEFMEYKKNKQFFVGTQFHPEYQSSRQNPHDFLKVFLHTCRNSVAVGRLR